MISERTLRKWRTYALQIKDRVKDMNPKSEPVLRLSDCALKMTQELLDQHLLRREK